MYRLFEFFYQYRAFMYFVLLEVVSIWLIVRNNNYQSAAFFNSANRYAGSIMGAKNGVQEYFNLKQENQKLAEENSQLKKLVTIQQHLKDMKLERTSDSVRAYRYQFIPAKIVNNSTSLYKNYITLDKGTADGLHKGMGIVSPEGVVGRIKDCSEHFCTAFSILNTSIQILGKVKGKGILCTVKWEGKNPHEASMLHVTRNQKIKTGDTIITSGYNPYFPEGIQIGKIKEIEAEGGSYWKASIDLSTDFAALNYVYVIENKLETEQDSLETVSTKSEP